MKTRSWIVLLSIVFVVLAGLSALLHFAAEPARTAEVYSDGRLVRTVDLSQEQTFTVEHGGGYNIVTVRNGKISVTEASCGNQACVACGGKNSGAPIVCLPNRLVIHFSEQAAVDAVVG